MKLSIFNLTYGKGLAKELISTMNHWRIDLLVHTPWTMKFHPSKRCCLTEEF